MEEDIKPIESKENKPSDDVNDDSKKSEKENSVINSISNDTSKVTYENKLNSIDNKDSVTKTKEINSEPKKLDVKPKKELPIEKKPFQEFIISHLIPSIVEEFNQRGFEIEDINLKNTLRPIALDKCWVIQCKIENTCDFWLSFEREDISSLKSISLSKPNQEPSIIESFLIDEKRITLKLIISRILQRLNGQKLIGFN